MESNFNIIIEPFSFVVNPSIVQLASHCIVDQKYWMSELSITEQVEEVIRLWVNQYSDIHPEEFLHNILESRGYEDNYFSTELFLTENIVDKLSKRYLDYDLNLIEAVRASDLNKLQALYIQGYNLSACNKYMESVVHLAARRSNADTFGFLIQHIPNIVLVDDMGRTPLHDAFWRVEPNYDIVKMVLDRNILLLHGCDRRNHGPLQYIRREHWQSWNAFLSVVADQYWPEKVFSTISTDGSISTS